ncbi:hypothetical protein [Kribbella solani]|uniref:DNA-binding MarR family transcriptional regulator n=1 Tax=Kribbella solani TaxID=236067 RepID=A0A841E0W1_9ACTN|nr:hypothetical protein [Kribbella solani]MBB5982645.1 DNA-binding MarR family transcriptional regulator [Kribbella solani]
MVREPDPEDGRGTQLRLTLEGVELAGRAVAAGAAAHHEHWANLPTTAVTQAAESLRALTSPETAVDMTKGRSR